MFCLKVVFVSFVLNVTILCKSNHIHRSIKSPVEDLLSQLHPDTRGISWRLYVNKMVSHVDRCHLRQHVRPYWCSSYKNIIQYVWRSLQIQGASQSCKVETCKPNARNTNLFLASFGSIHYSESCKMEWIIKINPMFSFNITLLYYESVLQPAKSIAFSSDEERWNYIRRYRHQELLHRGFSLVFKNPFTFYHGINHIASFGGKLTRSSIYFGGDLLYIMISPILKRTNVHFALTYQIFGKLSRFHYEPSTHSYVTPGRYMYRGLIVDSSRRSMHDHYVPDMQLPMEYMTMDDKHIVRIGLHTYFMWQIAVALHYSWTTPVTNITMIFVDGPTLAWSSEILFPTNQCVLNMDTSLPYQVHSTLNDATLFLQYDTLYADVLIMSFMYMRDNCTSIHCHEVTTAIYQPLGIQHLIKTSNTEVYNMTYYIPIELTETSFLAVNISLLRIKGLYTPLCEYGGVILTYSEGSVTQPLGMYCSVGTIQGLLKAAQPLHLGAGSLSILIKNYAPVNQIHLRFTVYISPCMGIFSSDFPNLDNTVSTLQVFLPNALVESSFRVEFSKQLLIFFDHFVFN